MTTTETQTETTRIKPATSDTWDAQFAEPKTRYPKVREPIHVALYIITQNPGIKLHDAKAQAKLHGARITAASAAAAQRLLSRQDGTGGASLPARRKASNAAPAATTRRTRRPRATASKATDPEALIREVADKIRGQGAAEAERLRSAMRKALRKALRKAIDLLTVAVE